MVKIYEEKKNISQNYSTGNCLELQCLIGDFRTINVCQRFFTLNILFDEKDRGLENFFRYRLYSFFLKTVMEETVIHLFRINTVQKMMTMCKKDGSTFHQKSVFTGSKGVGVSLDIRRSKKAWKGLLHNIYQTIERLCHKGNLITTIVTIV